MLSMERSDSLYLVALLSFIISLCALPLSLYLLPQVWLGWNYHIPDFIVNLNVYLQDSTGLSEQMTNWIVFYTLLGLALCSALLAHWISFHARLDRKKQLLEEEDVLDDSVVRLKQANQHRTELFFLGVKAVFILGIVFFIIQMVEWLISVYPNE